MTDWPTREQYEAERRAYAEHLIEHSGVGYEYTDAECDEIARLAPEIIRTVRRECGRIERRLRREHPDVVWLLKPGVDAYLDGRVDAALDALSPAACAAVDTLRKLCRVRQSLQCENWKYPHPHGRRSFGGFASPEIDRLRALHEQALDRYHDSERQRGHQLLADIESGAAWRRQLEHRARIDEWHRKRAGDSPGLALIAYSPIPKSNTASGRCIWP